MIYGEGSSSQLWLAETLVASISLVHFLGKCLMRWLREHTARRTVKNDGFVQKFHTENIYTIWSYHASSRSAIIPPGFCEGIKMIIDEESSFTKNYRAIKIIRIKLKIHCWSAGKYLFYQIKYVLVIHKFDITPVDFFPGIFLLLHFKYVLENMKSD